MKRSALGHWTRAALACAALLVALAAAGCTQGGGEATTQSPAATTGAPWDKVPLVQPADLAGELQGGAQPLLVHVGFRPLYKAGAIPGSRYAGPGSRPEGIEALKGLVANEPRERAVVIYCGCCPWKDCPNMKPAAATLAELGFTNARAMMVPKNFDTDWAGKGYPVAKGAD